jgi:hypothetical protein
MMHRFTYKITRVTNETITLTVLSHPRITIKPRNIDECGRPHPTSPITYTKNELTGTSYKIAKSANWTFFSCAEKL